MDKEDKLLEDFRNIFSTNLKDCKIIAMSEFFKEYFNSEIDNTDLINQNNQLINENQRLRKIINIMRVLNNK